MEKISRIIPANARVSTVDLKNSGVARSGSPGFGREVGMSSVARRELARSQAEAKGLLQKPDEKLTKGIALEQHKDLMKTRSESTDPQVQMIQDLADKFFISQKNRVDDEINIQHDANSDLVPTPAEDVSLEPTQSELAAAPNENADEAQASQDDGTSGDTPVKGRHLDVQA